MAAEMFWLDRQGVTPEEHQYVTLSNVLTL